MGLPQPAAGSGYALARSSLGPAALRALVWPSATSYYPSAKKGIASR
ncbi:hypothetical protein SGRA_0382 [Saprospira grandis str. Lewin]|uniref:Uncharacterized protein n=1 Tax=Saprospira grandis (strain Lewin) TaxID=984262 RepID=H6L8Y5_SAPGL|nr:hypothetical protein SGRA_0382 [Saprospira grandis str. Lewin]